MTFVRLVCSSLLGSGLGLELGLRLKLGLELRLKLGLGLGLVLVLGLGSGFGLSLVVVVALNVGNISMRGRGITDDDDNGVDDDELKLLITKFSLKVLPAEILPTGLSTATYNSDACAIVRKTGPNGIEFGAAPCYEKKGYICKSRS